MVHDQDLFGKTFDQQLELTRNSIANRDISPNRRISGEIVFEPVLNGVRVTARDQNHKVLWGFIGSKGMIEQSYCPVAVYDTLQAILSDELRKHGLPASGEGDALQTAEQALSDLRNTIDNLKSVITVKKASKATIERAKAIGKIARDADRMIRLETSSFKAINEDEERANAADV